jgi:hypothetical protein
MPVIILNSSLQRWVKFPVPLEAMLILPERVLGCDIDALHYPTGSKSPSANKSEFPELPNNARARNSHIFNAQEIVEHALALGALKVAFLFPTARVHAAHWLELLPVAHQYFLTPRPSVPPITAKKVGGGSVDFSWLVIDLRHKGPPTWGWLHRDSKR